MNGRTFIDTNVLVYLFDTDSPEKRDRARSLFESRAADFVLSTQVLQEFYVTVTRKLASPLEDREALAATRSLTALLVIPLDAQSVLDAIGLSQQNQVSLWDALILTAAIEAEYERLLTEDLQDGWKVRGLRVENPFADLS